jgi:hypothetical protein
MAGTGIPLCWMERGVMVRLRWLIPASILTIALALSGLNRSGMCLAEMRYLSTPELNARFEKKRLDFIEWHRQNEKVRSPEEQKKDRATDEGSRKKNIVWADDPIFLTIAFQLDSFGNDKHSNNLIGRWTAGFSHYRTEKFKSANHKPGGRLGFVRFYPYSNCGNLLGPRSSYFVRDLYLYTITLTDKGMVAIY